MNQLEISKEALKNNMRSLQLLSPKGAKMRAMVKANAYGVGIEAMVPTLESLGVIEFGVATLSEGSELRELLKNSNSRIYIMSGYKEWNAPGMQEVLRVKRLIPVISSLEELEAARKLFGDGGGEIELKFNTGMNRLGIDSFRAKECISLLLAHPELKLIGIGSHLACADSKEVDFTALQSQKFLQILKSFQEAGFRNLESHLLNSGGLLQRRTHPELASYTTVVRPGLLLFGIDPREPTQSQMSEGGTSFQPVLRWRSSVLEVHEVDKGEGVGYGLSWVGEKKCRVATLPVGYADGFNRRLSNRGRVLIGEKSYPIVGRVSMDLTTVLVDEGVEPQDEVVLMGRALRGGDEISVWEIATECDTIPYEILTSLGSRIQRTLI